VVRLSFPRQQCMPGTTTINQRATTYCQLSFIRIIPPMEASNRRWLCYIQTDPLPKTAGVVRGPRSGVQHATKAEGTDI
jgi:hypothetical protein